MLTSPLDFEYLNKYFNILTGFPIVVFIHEGIKYKQIYMSYSMPMYLLMAQNNVQSVIKITSRTLSSHIYLR